MQEIIPEGILGDIHAACGHVEVNWVVVVVVVVVKMQIRFLKVQGKP